MYVVLVFLIEDPPTQAVSLQVGRAHLLLLLLLLLLLPLSYSLASFGFGMVKTASTLFQKLVS